MDSASTLENRRFTKIQTRLAIAFAVMAAIITVTITVMLFIQARRNLYSQFQDRLTILIKQAEPRQWPDLIANIKSEPDEGTPVYDFLKQEQRIFMANDPTIGSVYSLRQDQLGTIFYLVGVLSSDLTEKKPPIHFGVFIDSPRQALLDAFKSNSQFTIENNTHSDETGTWISAYAPIVASDGRKVGVFGFDISAKSLVDAERNMLITSIILMALALPIFAGIGWVLGNRLARPIVELTNGVNQITAGDLVHRVEIKSGDEIEVLADSFNIMTSRLKDLVEGLEQRVEDRTSNLTLKTKELEEASRRLANRAGQLAAVSVVARAVTTMRDVNQLLPNIATTISQQFGFYHVGIFLNDAGNQYAVLRAANSEGGQRMLDQGHRLKIGQVGIVGNVASSGKPRIALDTGEDAVFFNNPNLPSTKSEMALPLKISEKIIGVLDVQSTESAAFKQEDVEILSILADQVSIAIENARLFEEAQKSSADAQSALRQYARTDWGRIQRTRQNKGYRYSYKGIESLPKTVPLSDESFTDKDMSVIKIPLTIREEQIGSLGLLLPSNKKISDDEMDIARAIAERVALSVENARLFEETSSRAEREKTVADISNKIRSTNDPETMIQTALKELKNALGASKIQILPYSTSVSPAPQPTPKKARKPRVKSQD